jgi:hypothetical protein
MRALLLLLLSVLLIQRLPLSFLLHLLSQAAGLVATVSLRSSPPAKTQAMRRAMRLEIVMISKVVMMIVVTMGVGNRIVIRRRKPLLCGLAHQKAALAQVR